MINATWFAFSFVRCLMSMINAKCVPVAMDSKIQTYMGTGQMFAIIIIMAVLHHPISIKKTFCFDDLLNITLGRKF